MRRMVTGMLAVVWVFLSGCTGQAGPSIPLFAGSRILHNQSTTQDLPKATVHNSVYQAPAFYAEVVKFYKDKLGAMPGWKMLGTSDDITGWDNGNIDKIDIDSGKPRDPSKYGGYVGVFKGEGNCTVVIVESVPK